MFYLKLLIFYCLCVNSVYGFYVPDSNSDDNDDVANDQKLFDDLTIIKNKLQSTDKEMSSLDNDFMTKNENLLTNSSKSSDRTARFINFKKFVKLSHHNDDDRNDYEHSRSNNYYKQRKNRHGHDHTYCDRSMSSEEDETGTSSSSYHDWVKYYEKFKMTQQSTHKPSQTTVNTRTTTAIPIINPDQLSSSSMAHEYDEFDVRKGDNFNEIELISLIPLVIDHLKTDRLTSNDRRILSKVYGELWLILDEESKRDHNNEKINPILKLILQLKHLHKREIDRREYTDDYHGNSVQQIKNTNNDRDIVDQPLRIKLGLTENLKQLSPSQRILRTIAMLINNSKYNYVPAGFVAAAGANTNGMDRKNMRLRKFVQKNRPHKNIVRIRRSSRHTNNNIGNDIDLYDSDEQYYRRRLSSNYDNPSINELIKLAEIHRLRRQQKVNVYNNKGSGGLLDKLYASNANENYDEYYYDDGPEADDEDEDIDEDDEYEDGDSEYDQY